MRDRNRIRKGCKFIEFHKPQFDLFQDGVGDWEFFTSRAKVAKGGR